MTVMIKYRIWPYPFSILHIAIAIAYCIRAEGGLIVSSRRMKYRVCANSGSGIEEQEQAGSVTRHRLSFADGDLDTIRQRYVTVHLCACIENLIVVCHLAYVNTN